MTAPQGPFFRMHRAQAIYLVALVLYSALIFVPAFRTEAVGGMAAYGWLLALLMVLSPVGAIVVFRISREDDA